MIRRMIFYFSAFTLLCTIGLSEVNAQYVVVPNVNEFSEGSSNNNLPFNLTNPLRYQQVYDSSQFSQCGRVFKVTQINFRLDTTVPQPPINDVTIPDISIELSTTSATPQSLSTTFANNVGDDVTTVYDGALTISAPECVVGPCPFDIVINLETPFEYIPLRGNLLLDIVKQDSPNTATFDAEEMTPYIARAWNVGNPDAETGTDDFGNTVGLITQFGCEPVPVNIPTLSEWGLTLMVVVIGLAGLIAIRRRRAEA